jgi:hypothetical protein
VIFIGSPWFRVAFFGVRRIIAAFFCCFGLSFWAERERTAVQKGKESGDDSPHSKKRFRAIVSRGGAGLLRHCRKAPTRPVPRHWSTGEQGGFAPGSPIR